ncbi:MAG TPA: hypothetical protein EYO87_08270, partial [Paracoccus sp.]|nr:hypothetical protein [Paracoccus sp. (in: a-proteobacteria)]
RSCGSTPWAPTARTGATVCRRTIPTRVTVTNNAVAVIVTPVAISLGQQLGVDPRPLVVAVMMGASASFATPIGYQTNTLVYGPGGYRFSDFIRVGLPLNLLMAVTASAVIPIFWPL